MFYVGYHLGTGRSLSTIKDGLLTVDLFGWLWRNRCHFKYCGFMLLTDTDLAYLRIDSSCADYFIYSTLVYPSVGYQKHSLPFMAQEG